MSSQFGGFSILLPDIRNFNRSAVCIDGYGVLPNVTISYSKIPYDQLWAENDDFYVMEYMGDRLG